MKHYSPTHYGVLTLLILFSFSQHLFAKSSLPKYCKMSFNNSNTGKLTYKPLGCLEKSIKEERLIKEGKYLRKCLKEQVCFGINWKTDSLERIKKIDPKSTISIPENRDLKLGTLEIATMAGRDISIIKYLLDKGASVNLNEGQYMLHPLTSAVNSYNDGLVKNLDIVDLLVKKGADVNARDERHGSTALILSEDIKMIKYLVKNGAKVNDKNKFGVTALYRSKDINTIKYLVKNGAKVDIKGMSNQTPLFHKRNKEVINYFLEHGIAIDAKDDEGKTALYRACHTNYGHEDILKYLIQKGAKVNSRANNGSTPLHMASHSGDKNAIKMLVIHKAKINIRDIDGKTPLHYATNEKWPANKRNVETVEALLELGAKANLKDRSGKTPFDYAKNNKYFKGTDTLWKLNDLQFE